MKAILSAILASIIILGCIGVDEETLNSINDDITLLKTAIVTFGDQLPGGLDARMTRDYYIGNEEEMERAKKYIKAKYNLDPDVEKPRFEVTVTFKGLTSPLDVDLLFANNHSRLVMEKYSDDVRFHRKTLHKKGGTPRPTYKEEIREKIKNALSNKYSPNKAKSCIELDNLVEQYEHAKRAAMESDNVKSPSVPDIQNSKHFKQLQKKCRDETLAENSKVNDSNRDALINAIMLVFDDNAIIPSEDFIRETWEGAPVCFIIMPKKQLENQPKNLQIFLNLHVSEDPKRPIGEFKKGEQPIPVEKLRECKPFSYEGEEMVFYSYNVGQQDLELAKQIEKLSDLEKAMKKWRKEFINKEI